jgi:hypothetical protein
MDTIPPFQDKNIVLGVCGGIAAYKVADLASKLTQAGALVDVILTESGRWRARARFPTSATLPRDQQRHEALSARPAFLRVVWL